MNKKPFSAPLFVLTLTIMLGSVFPSHGGEPTESIRAAVNQGVEILNGARLDDKKQRADVINRLRKVVYPLFDFNEMAKRSLGAHWRRITPKQQTEFTSAFTDLLEYTYADKINLYDGQSVAYTAESVDSNYAQVDTKVIGTNTQSFSVVYRLHRVDGKWRIYDVVVENISVVNNYRSQFNRVIGNSSFQELMKRLKEKAG